VEAVGAVNAPLIIGAGPAGCAAAITLAQQGHAPTIMEKQSVTQDAICGGFMSWRTLETLRALSIDPDSLGGHPVSALRLFSGERSSSARLPHTAIGVSRHRLDSVMQARAEAMGVTIQRGQTFRGLGEGSPLADHPGGLFLATGKHDVKGLARPRADTGERSMVGLRVRLPASPALLALVGGAIELHLFPGGYAGLVAQEDGSANLCMAVRKSVLSQAGSDPAVLLAQLADAHPVLAERMAHAQARLPIDAIAAIPYGWRTSATRPGLFRLGDQAAVIPSLAGEGIGLALASGRSAAQHWIERGVAAAADYQRHFSQAAALPVGFASLFWHLAESASGAAAMMAAARIPGAARLAASLTRVGVV